MGALLAELPGVSGGSSSCVTPAHLMVGHLQEPSQRVGAHG